MKMHRFGRLRAPAKVRKVARNKKLASIVSVLALLVLGGVGVVLHNSFAATTNYTWRIGSSAGITITESLSDVYYLNTVRVDGLTGGTAAVCMANAGTVSGGVATISLSVNCLEKLSVGAHTLSFEFIDDTNVSSPQYETFQYGLTVTSPSARDYSWQKGSASGITVSEDLSSDYYLNTVRVDSLTGGTTAVCLSNSATYGSGTVTIAMSVSCLESLSVGSHVLSFEFIDDTDVSNPLYVTFSYNLTITAVAAETTYTYTLSFNVNNGTGTVASQSCTTTSTSCTVTIPSTQPTRSGYTFKGWGNSSSATSAVYQSGSTVTLTANKTLYAVWTVNDGDGDDNSSDDDGGNSDGSSSGSDGALSGTSESNGVAVPNTGAAENGNGNGTEAMWMLAGVAVVVVAGAAMMRRKHTAVDFNRK